MRPTVQRTLTVLVLAGACAFPCAAADQPTPEQPDSTLVPGDATKLLLLDRSEGSAREASERVVGILFWAAMGALGLVAGLFLIKLVYNLAIEPLHSRKRTRRYFNPQRPDQEALCRRAERLARNPRHAEEAVDLFEHAGAHERAAECAEQNGLHARAADLWRRAGRPGHAARIHMLKLGDPLAAAEVLRAAGQFQRAAEIFRKGGDEGQAAMMFELGGQPLEAARIHEAIGNLARAAKLHEEAGDMGKASELRARLAEQGVVNSPEDAGYLADLMLRSGRRDRAAEYLALAGARARAIELLLADGEVDRAARMHAEQPDGLGEQLLALIPEGSPSSERLAQMLIRARDYSAGGRALERLGRHEEAARLYSRAGEHAHAAAMYLQQGERERAAMAFERAGDTLQAAQLFEALGKVGRAAALYETSGAPFRAGRLWFDLDNRERALRQLQRVGADHEDHFEAARMIAEMLLDRGEIAAAAERLRTITAGRACEPETVRAFYALALADLRLGRGGPAMETLTRVTAYEPGYRDAGRLLEALRSGDRSAAADLLPDLFGRETLAPQTGGGT